VFDVSVSFKTMLLNRFLV